MIHFLKCCVASLNFWPHHLSHLSQNGLTLLFLQHIGFPDSSPGKESACNAGDPISIPGLGRSTAEGRGYLLQYSWASLVAQMVKKSPAMRETWVRSLGWEDPLEKGKATHSSILAWRILWTVHECIVQGVVKSWTRLRDSLFIIHRTYLHLMDPGMLFLWPLISSPRH